MGFSPALDAAVKTGTAQTGNPQANTDDWMIGFAPANNPKIAVAVVVPFQNFVGTGAGIAGPIMKAMLDAAVLPTVDRGRFRPQARGKVTTGREEARGRAVGHTDQHGR